MAEVDRNHDGKINFEEFQQAMSRVASVEYRELNSMIANVSYKIRRKIQELSIQQGDEYNSI